MKFCPKCGAQLEEDALKCEKCGFELPAQTEEAAPAAPEAPAPVASAPQAAFAESPAAKKQFSAVNGVFFALAAIVFILCFIAAGKVAEGGLDIASIESVGGKTLEEAYYQYSGPVYAGYAMFIRAAGVFFASVLGYFGVKG